MLGLVVRLYVDHAHGRIQTELLGRMAATEAALDPYLCRRRKYFSSNSYRWHGQSLAGADTLVLSHDVSWPRFSGARIPKAAPEDRLCSGRLSIPCTG